MSAGEKWQNDKMTEYAQKIALNKYLELIVEKEPYICINLK